MLIVKAKASLELSQLERQLNMKPLIIEDEAEYDLSKLKSRPNPYAKRLRKQITLKVGLDVIAYFEQLSQETGIPYQNLINLYLRDCMASQRQLKLEWLQP